jgi:hypothetical protein
MEVKKTEGSLLLSNDSESFHKIRLYILVFTGSQGYEEANLRILSTRQVLPEPQMVNKTVADHFS